MTANYILDNDANGTARKVLTELLDTDKHAQSQTLYANGVLVSTAAPLPITAPALTSADATLTSWSVARSATPGASQAGIVPMAVRADTLSALAEANGEASPLKVDANGALYAMQAGALSAAIDSIFVRPYSPGATYGKYTKRFTTTAGEIAIAAPGTGFRVVVTNCRVSCRGTTAGQITVFEDTNANGAFDTSTEWCIVDDDYAPTAALPTGSKSGPIYFQLAENKRLYVLSSAAISFTLMMEYFVEAMP